MKRIIIFALLVGVVSAKAQDGMICSNVGASLSISRASGEMFRILYKFSPFNDQQYDPAQVRLDVIIPCTYSNDPAKFYLFDCHKMDLNSRIDIRVDRHISEGLPNGNGSDSGVKPTFTSDFIEFSDYHTNRNINFEFSDCRPL